MPQSASIATGWSTGASPSCTRHALIGPPQHLLDVDAVRFAREPKPADPPDEVRGGHEADVVSAVPQRHRQRDHRLDVAARAVRREKDPHWWGPGPASAGPWAVYSRVRGHSAHT